MANSVSSDMIRGHIDTIILLSLVDGDKHTNQIRETIEKRTAGAYTVKQGTFYSSLDRIKKQGFVEEYRLSTDGIRRVFLKLTDAGKDYINANRDSWSYSQNIINSLISDKPKVKVSFDDIKSSVKKVDKKDVSNAKLSEEYFDKLYKDVSQKSDSENTKPDNSIDNTKKTVKDVQPKIIIDNQTKKDIKVEKESASIRFIKEVNPIIEPNIETPIEKPVISEVPIEQPKSVFVEQPKPEIIEEKYDEPVVDKKTYYSEPTVNGPIAYKEILSKLFPARPSVEKNEEQPKQMFDYKPQQSVSNDNTYDGFQSFSHEVPVNEQPAYSNSYESPSNAFVAETDTLPKTSKYDFSDLNEMAENEGFRIKFSTSTNHEESGQVLINKLKFHSTLISYLLIVLELVVLFFTARDFLPFKLTDYLIFGGCLALIPFVFAIIYVSRPEMRVKDVYPFKKSIELALIIAVNLILIIFAFAILSDVSFTNIPQLMLYIVVPSIAVINIPLYILIRYALLEKSTYFSSRV